MSSVQVANLYEQSGLELVSGVTMKPLFGDGAMLNLLEFEPDTLVPAHSHPHEQLGLMLDGELVLQIGGVDHRLRPGDAYVIPGGVEHSAWTEGVAARCLDVFQPVREDYRDRAGG